ncbi:MAG: TolC family protein [Betaproteobacteria bacterium]|nr:TolC family protein [Betaproteobacteria bacterium]
MLDIALKMLFSDRLKYFGLVAGIAFATMLIVQQASILVGFTKQTGSFIRDTAQADLWLMDPQVRFAQDPVPLRDTALQMARGVPGVLWAAPLYQGSQRAKLPKVPALAAALPGELLARRPDLLAIERAVAAEHARIGVATSAAYPRLSLGLSLGFLAINGANLAASGSRQGSGGAQVQLPLFQGGAIHSGIEAAQARYEQARIRYETAAAVAVEEAERAALRLTRAQAREVQARRALEAHALSARLTQARYQQGLVDYLNVLDSERQHHALDDERLLAREQAAMEWVAMVKALGGGW